MSYANSTSGANCDGLESCPYHTFIIEVLGIFLTDKLRQKGFISIAKLVLTVQVKHC